MNYTRSLGHSFKETITIDDTSYTVNGYRNYGCPDTYDVPGVPDTVDIYDIKVDGVDISDELDNYYIDQETIIKELYRQVL